MLEQLFGEVSLAPASSCSRDAINTNLSLLATSKGWFVPYQDGLIYSCALYNKQAVKMMLGTASSLSFGYLLTDGEVSYQSRLSQSIEEEKNHNSHSYSITVGDTDSLC